MGCAFGFCFAGPLPLRFLTHGPLLRVPFGESLVFRLYSEIYHIHLSSEAQCDSHHLLPNFVTRRLNEYFLMLICVLSCEIAWTYSPLWFWWWVEVKALVMHYILILGILGWTLRLYRPWLWLNGFMGWTSFPIFSISRYFWMVGCIFGWWRSSLFTRIQPHWIKIE